MFVSRFAGVSGRIAQKYAQRPLSTAAPFTLDFRQSKLNAYLANLKQLLASGTGIDKQLGRKIDGVNVKRLRALDLIYSEAMEVLSEVSSLEQLRDEMMKANEKEMARIAENDLDVSLKKLRDISDQAWQFIIPYEPQDTDEVMVEFSAGVGGQEAMLFNGDLLRMYTAFARNQGWDCRVMDAAHAEAGGLRSGSVHISGTNVGKLLKFEGGVHRVQRTPKTERSGRVHTSTATVAVLPCPVEVEIVVDPKDLIVKTKRAGGPGGQHVNKTESAVQILHTPSGVMVEADIERSQQMNKEAAMKKLRAKLFELKIKQETVEVSSERKLQVGSAGRSEKIRTYNFVQDRVTDHRLGLSVHNLDECLAGGEPLAFLVNALQEAYRKELVQHLIEKQQYS